MLDILIGPVVDVVDGNTFTIKVTRIGNHNINRYYDYETVRIADRPAANVYTILGLNQKNKLRQLIINKTVSCDIRFRDQFNVLISDVSYYNP